MLAARRFCGSTAAKNYLFFMHRHFKIFSSLFLGPPFFFLFSSFCVTKIQNRDIHFRQHRPFSALVALPRQNRAPAEGAGGQRPPRCGRARPPEGGARGPRAPEPVARCALSQELPEAGRQTVQPGENAPLFLEVNDYVRKDERFFFLFIL